MEELLEKSQLKHLVIALAFELCHRREFGPNLLIHFDELMLFGDKRFFTEKGSFVYLDREFGKGQYEKSSIVERLEKKDKIRQFTESALKYKSEEIKQVLNKLFQDDNGVGTMYVGSIQIEFDKCGESVYIIYCSLVPSNSLENSFIIKYLKSKA